MPTQTFDHTLFIPNGDHEIPARVEKPAAATLMWLKEML